MVQGVTLINSAEALVFDVVVHNYFVQEPFKYIAQENYNWNCQSFRPESLPDMLGVDVERCASNHIDHRDM